MPIIGMIGANAVGKTTAVRRWCQRYTRLVGVCCDSQIQIMDGRESPSKGWQGTDAARQALIRKYQAMDRVVVLEGAAGYGCRIIREAKPVHTLIIVTNEDSMKAFLRDRCGRRGKEFRADYWTPKKLQYEGNHRCMNFARKELFHLDYTVVEINDQEKDWAEGDVVFGKLFRRYNRRSLR